MMDISTIKAVVFDCDGVMFDTAEVNRRYYNEILQSYGMPVLTQEQFVNVHMMTVKRAIEYLFPQQDDLSGIFDHLKQIGYYKFIQYMVMEEGLKELLQKLKDKCGERICIFDNLNPNGSLLVGNPEETVRETRAHLQKANSMTGYIFSTSGTTSPNIPKANFEAMNKEVLEFRS